MWTGSFINAVTSQTPNTPKVGDGATVLFWTDREAATVVAVSKNGKEVTTQDDTAIRTDMGGPFTEDQSYNFEANPNGTLREWTLRKNGCWVAKGSGMKNGMRCRMGSRNKYRDPCF